MCCLNSKIDYFITYFIPMYNKFLFHHLNLSQFWAPNEIIDGVLTKGRKRRKYVKLIFGYLRYFNAFPLDSSTIANYLTLKYCKRQNMLM